MTVELLKFEPEGPRTAQMFVALTTAARDSGITVTHTTAYEGQSDCLMLWGPGAPSRWPAMQAQRKRGGHVVAWDGAYWSRDRKLRCSIDAAHPQHMVMRTDLPDDRWQQDPAPVANAWNPEGPVVMAGLGEKARVQYGADQIDAWEAEMKAASRDCWPTRPVIYRAKDRQAQPIDAFILGASLTVTWHSNASVDAIRMGIPVVCRDGAAAAVCPATVTCEPQPLAPKVRDQFLSNLAYFQWAPNEAGQCWQFLQETLCAW